MIRRSLARPQKQLRPAPIFTQSLHDRDLAMHTKCSLERNDHEDVQLSAGTLHGQHSMFASRCQCHHAFVGSHGTPAECRASLRDKNEPGLVEGNMIC